MSSAELRVRLVGDVSGALDEGMKKSATNLCQALSRIRNLRVTLSDWSQALGDARDVDVIHQVGGPTIRTFMIAATAKKLNPEITTIITFSNPLIPRLLWPLLGPMQPDCVITQSAKWTNWATNRGMVTKPLILSGVDLDVYSPIAPRRKKFIRDRLRIANQDEPLWLHVGHLKRDRNLEPLVSLCKAENCHVLVITSTTTAKNHNLKDELSAAGVQVIDRYVKNIEEYYQASDLYVFPTVDPHAAIQVPLSILEAMSCNLPIISTRFGGLPEVFESVQGFRFVPIASGEMIRAAADDLMGEPVATREAVEEFDWRTRASKLRSLYGEVVQS